MRTAEVLGYNLQRAICKNDRLIIIVLERVACCYRIANYTRSLNPISNVERAFWKCSGITGCP